MLLKGVVWMKCTSLGIGYSSLIVNGICLQNIAWNAKENMCKNRSQNEPVMHDKKKHYQ